MKYIPDIFDCSNSNPSDRYVIRTYTHIRRRSPCVPFMSSIMMYMYLYT